MAGILATLGRSAVCATLVAGAGCASLGPRGTVPSDGFHARGQLALADRQDGFSASFSWRQQGERYDINVWGPLGHGRLRISGDDAAVTVADGRGKVVANAANQAQLGEQFGWPLPLGAMRYWLTGRCDPAAPCRQRDYDAANRLAGIAQHGWKVRLADWREETNGPLPGRLTATQGQRRIKVAVREWR